MPKILMATEAHLPQLLPLFDAYRQFYGQESDLAGAGEFLKNRIRKQESILFLALSGTAPAGFTQLFRSFSSVSLQPLLILNDLFVAAPFRKKGIGEALLLKAQDYCREKKYKGLALETAVDNRAQYLYERLGWEKDSRCFHYFWKAGQ